MLPLLLTAGQGLAWLALTIGQLMLWGFGMSIGFALGKSFTGFFEEKIVHRLQASKVINHRRQSGVNPVPA